MSNIHSLEQDQATDGKEDKAGNGFLPSALTLIFDLACVELHEIKALKGQPEEMAFLGKLELLMTA